jgi:hypothetical protein
MQTFSVLESQIEAAAKYPSPRSDAEKKPQISFSRTHKTATEVHQIRRILFKRNGNQSTDQVTLPPLQLRRGRLLTLAVVLMMAVSAQAQSAFSACQLGTGCGSFTQNRAASAIPASGWVQLAM